MQLVFQLNFPKIKEKFYEFGLEGNVFKKEKVKKSSEKTVLTLSLYITYALSELDEELTSWEENTLFLMEQMILLYNNGRLCPKFAKVMFEMSRTTLEQVLN